MDGVDIGISDDLLLNRKTMVAKTNRMSLLNYSPLSFSGQIATLPKPSF